MGVRARFFLQSITENLGAYQVVLQPVTRATDDNKWSKYTPSGKLEMSITNEDAMPFFKDLFVQVKAGERAYPEVFLDITYADDIKAGPST